MKFKIFIIILSLLGCFFIAKVFLSDFFLNKHEVHIMDEYFVLEINGEYNLMHKEEHGYGLIIPSVLYVYIKQKEIIAVSSLSGNNFINNNYKRKSSASENRYYYEIRQYKVQEINKEKFLKQKKMYRLLWQLK
ncbi:hypothetical protein [Chryseobacterium gleum]|uniref:hypothetical protein n=1 Tax=Chryseobacterium gleum TaxID=250 RepID=UPI00241C96FD|nr:hypothetical protein [Chryseobacterium gleum]